MKLFKEWTINKNGRRGTMVEVGDLQRALKLVYNPGYASVYSFNEDAAIEILESGCSQGFNKYCQYSDQIVIDLDDGADSVQSVEDTLASRGLGYDVYFSGGKGHHFVLFHELIGSEDLAYSHLQFIRSLGIKCDETLYQPSRIVSLPGRVHERTKLRKRLIRSVPGGLVDLKLVPRPILQFEYSEQTGLDSIESGLVGLISLVLCEPDVGGRYMAHWKVARDLLRSGVSQAAVLELLMKVQESWVNPKSVSEVERAVKGACP